MDDSVKFEAVREGSTRELPGETGRELLRVGQEAVANAIRHSRCDEDSCLARLPADIG